MTVGLRQVHCQKLTHKALTPARAIAEVDNIQLQWTHSRNAIEDAQLLRRRFQRENICLGRKASMKHWKFNRDDVRHPRFREWREKPSDIRWEEWKQKLLGEARARDRGDLDLKREYRRHERA
jgi:hypothetical protein